jgi:hypothetical protein
LAAERTHLSRAETLAAVATKRADELEMLLNDTSERLNTLTTALDGAFNISKTPPASVPKAVTASPRAAA